MQGVDQGGDIAGPAFRLLHFFLDFLIFIGAVAAARWGIRNFLLKRGERNDRWRNIFSAVSIVAVVLFLLLQGPADRVLTALGDGISRLRPESGLDWLS